MVAAASAGHIFNQPQAEHYANAADIYQSAVEYQQPAIQAGHSLSAHDLAYQRPSAEKTAKILAYHSENNGHNYHYAYETENGIKAQESGQVSKGTQAEGAYSYTGDDGQVYTVKYTADENGFRAYGAHLPTSPPIPEAILKSLEENSKAEANGIYDDGHYHEQHQTESYHDGGVQSYHDGGVQSYHDGGVQSYHDGGVQSYHDGGAQYHEQQLQNYNNAAHAATDSSYHH
ncbi:cuticle protein 2-like [Nymphalis io]|uniref:cuticle protein 2-like n=1 Tax=Inachis io TaxID=171585 RepID=UPI00216A1EC9|nr:cuticle protein 2-like [Nymphalis io]